MNSDTQELEKILKNEGIEAVVLGSPAMTGMELTSAGDRAGLVDVLKDLAKVHRAHRSRDDWKLKIGKHESLVVHLSTDGARTLAVAYVSGHPISKSVVRMIRRTLRRLANPPAPRASAPEEAPF